LGRGGPDPSLNFRLQQGRRGRGFLCSPGENVGGGPVFPKKHKKRRRGLKHRCWCKKRRIRGATTDRGQKSAPPFSRGEDKRTGPEGGGGPTGISRGCPPGAPFCRLFGPPLLGARGGGGVFPPPFSPFFPPNGGEAGNPGGRDGGFFCCNLWGGGGGQTPVSLLSQRVFPQVCGGPEGPTLWGVRVDKLGAQGGGKGEQQKKKGGGEKTLGFPNSLGGGGRGGGETHQMGFFVWGPRLKALGLRIAGKKKKRFHPRRAPTPWPGTPQGPICFYRLPTPCFGPAHGGRGGAPSRLRGGTSFFRGWGGGTPTTRGGAFCFRQGAQFYVWVVLGGALKVFPTFFRFAPRGGPFENRPGGGGGENKGAPKKFLPRFIARIWGGCGPLSDFPAPPPPEKA